MSGRLSGGIRQVGAKKGKKGNETHTAGPRRRAQVLQPTSLDGFDVT